MPANLTPQFHEAEEKFKRAETTEDRILALEEMLRVIPKHKGTEKMQADLKRRLSKLRDSAEKEKAAGGPKRPFHYVEPEGIGRVVICGPPNAGKSSLVDRLTHAEPEVTDYPFATRKPLPGMMQYEDVQIQLIDTPPLDPEILELWQMAMIEQADIAVLLFDAGSPSILEQTEYVLGIFSERSIPLVPSGSSHVVVFGNKVDRDSGAADYEAWCELFEGRLEPRPFSCHSEKDLESFRKEMFDRLNLVRIYTKKPTSKPVRDGAPYVLKKGSTVLDAAAHVHKDLAEGLKFARIWGSEKYEGQKVERDYVLEDRDLLEIHT